MWEQDQEIEAASSRRVTLGGWGGVETNESLSVWGNKEEDDGRVEQQQKTKKFNR